MLLTIVVVLALLILVACFGVFFYFRKSRLLGKEVISLNEQLQSSGLKVAAIIEEEERLQSQISAITAQQKAIEEQKKKLEEKNKKIWQMGEAAVKAKRKIEEQNTELQTEREKLGGEKIKLDQKIKKLWQTSTAIHKEKERINSLYEQIEDAKNKSDELLLNILPEEAAGELKANGFYEPRTFDNVSVLFTDFKNFTTFSERLTATELVNELNVCFKAFDEIVTRYGIEKIKTVGDAYMAAAGLPTANAAHAEDMVMAAIEIRNFMIQRKSLQGDNTWEVRVGIHSGSVVAGIVGSKKYLYDIWGDTVNTAARMEQRGEPGKVNISEVTYQLVKDKFNCHYRGEIEAKNKGKLKMYFVEPTINQPL